MTKRLASFADDESEPRFYADAQPLQVPRKRGFLLEQIRHKQAKGFGKTPSFGTI